MKTVLAVGLSPGIQKTILFPDITAGGVNRSRSYRLDASGKAVNAARVLLQLGGNSIQCVCPLGRDNGELFMSLARMDGLEVIPVWTGGNVRYCYTLIEENSGCITELVVGEPVLPSDTPPVEIFRAELDARLRCTDFLVIAGSIPAPWPEGIYSSLIATARTAGIPVLADFQGAELRRCLDSTVPDIIKINAQEFIATLTDLDPSAVIRDDELGDLVASTSRSHGCTIIVTRGLASTVCGTSGPVRYFPVTPVTAVNTIGCGDAFNAGVVHTLLAGGKLEQAVEEGHRCASANARSIRPGSVLD